MGTGLDSYKFTAKKIWRKQVWNQICKRLTIPRKDAVVMYLAGPEDLDRKEALQRGFLDRNMIAVDRDKSVVESLRRQAKIAFWGDISDAMLSQSFEPDVIIADFCCGFSKSVISFQTALLATSYHERIIVVNQLRGRDQFTQQFRKNVEELEGYSIKKRGRAFLYNYLARVQNGIGKIAAQMICDIFNSGHGVSEIEYKSKCNGATLVFDTIIFCNPSYLKKQSIEYLFDDDEPKKTKVLSAKRQMTALKAVRTMRVSN